MDNTILLSYLIICCCASLAVVIDELVVPEALEYEEGNKEEVILDCKFRLQNKSETDDLVIKWFFPDTKNLIYQWIPPVGKPQAVGILKDKVDLTYAVSNDPNTKYRALKIIDVTPKLTGAYTCQVSNLYSEASVTKKMVIYEPPKKFVFDHFTNASLFLCSAYEIFPKPIMNVYAEGSNLTKIDDGDEDEENDLESSELDEDTVEEANGLYSVTASFKYRPSDVTEPTDFICEVTIPNTNFRETLRQTYYPDGEPTTTTTDYDYESSTIFPITENAGSFRNLNALLLSTFVCMTVLKIFL